MASKAGALRVPTSCASCVFVFRIDDSECAILIDMCNRQEHGCSLGPDPSIETDCHSSVTLELSLAELSSLTVSREF